MMNRQKAIVRTSIIGILTNIVLVGFKMLVGFLSGSIAIILDAVNNLTDVLSSVATIIGTKLAARRPDAGHPYGHGRIEYLTTLFIGVIILSTGGMALFESVPKIIHPELADYTWATITVVIAATVVKLILGTYVRRAGKRFDSDSLRVSGLDALFDAVLSFATLVGILVTLVFHISIDGILGAIISAFIIKSSINVLQEAASAIIGQTVDQDLIRAVTAMVESFPEVIDAHSLMLHNYGPHEFIGSIDIQVSSNLTANEICQLTRKISRRVRAKFGIKLTVSIHVH